MEDILPLLGGANEAQSVLNPEITTKGNRAREQLGLGAARLSLCWTWG